MCAHSGVRRCVGASVRRVHGERRTGRGSAGWGWDAHAGWGPHHTFFREGSGFGQPRSAASYKE